MKTITVTRYARGKRVPDLPQLPLGGNLSAEAMVIDMFHRILAGATTTTSGYNYGLRLCTGPADYPTGSDSAIYGGLSSKMQDFLIRATRWWLEDGMELGSPEHVRFVRRHLLVATGHTELSSAHMDFALEMPHGDFIEAMAMALETNETVEALFE